MTSFWGTLASYSYMQSLFGWSTADTSIKNRGLICIHVSGFFPSLIASRPARLSPLYVSQCLGAIVRYSRQTVAAILSMIVIAADKSNVIATATGVSAIVTPGTGS